MSSPIPGLRYSTFTFGRKDCREHHPAKKGRRRDEEEEEEEAGVEICITLFPVIRARNAYSGLFRSHKLRSDG